MSQPAASQREEVICATFQKISQLLAVGTAVLAITLCEPAARVDQLDNVDKLLEQHDRGSDASDDPGPEAVDLVCAGHLERTGTPRAGKKTARHRVGGVSGLHRGRLGVADGLEERGRQDRRREGEQIEADEEQLIESAANEQDNLVEQRQSVLNIHTSIATRNAIPCCGNTGKGPSYGWSRSSCGSDRNHPCSASHTCACSD